MALKEVGIKLSLEGGQQVEAGLQKVAGGAATVAKTIAGITGGFSAMQFATKLVDVQRQFDVLNSSLITVTGSSGAAAKEFAWIKQFASTTPFQLNEVTGAFVKMKALGLDATQGALTSYGNTASAMGKSLNQMVEAVADASTGEFERLKEFGIKAKTSGDQVSLTFQGITTTVGNSAAGITKYLQDIGNIEFAGAMVERAKTLDGAISNLADNWGALFLTISQNNAGGLMADSVTLANGAISDAITILKSLDSATQTSASSTGALSTAQEGLAIVFETVAVLAANVKYVVTGIGTEIGGLAAQAAQLLQGNLSGAAAIGKAMREDAAAARKEVDSTTAAILLARQNAANATQVNAQASARLARQSTDTAAAIVAHTTATTTNAAAAKAAQAALDKLTQSYQKQAQAAADARNKEYADIDSYMAAMRLKNIEDANAAEAAVRAAQEEFDNHGKLRSAIEETTLARLQDRLVNLQAGTEAYDSLARQIGAQKRLIGIFKQGEARDAAADAATAAADEWKKASEKIEQDITDALMRGFESGKGFAENLKDTLENMFKTMVLRPVIQGVVQSGMSAVGGALGGSNSFAGNLLGSAASNYGSSILGAGGLFASNAAYGAAIGTTSIAAGSQAAMLAAQTGSFGAAGLSATAGAAGGAASTIAAAVPWIGGALLIGSLLKNDKISSRGTGEGTIGYDATGTQLASESRYTGEWGLTPAVQKSVDGLAASYINTAKSLGIAAIETEWAFGGNTGKQSADPQFAIGVNAGGASYSSGEMQLNDANIALATSRALLTALQASDLPEHLSGVFDGITASAATQEQITASLGAAQALSTFHKSLGLLPVQFKNLADLSYESTQALIGLSGGLDALNNNLGTYYTNFYTQEEQRAQTVKNINAAVFGSGLDAATATREQFRQIVEAQDLTTESGQKMYAALLGVSGAFAQISVSAQSLMDGVSKSVSDSIYNMQYGMADNQGKYGMLDVQAAGYNDKMLASNDINEIAKLAASQIDVINKAWGLLDEGQQKATYSQFETKLEAIDTFVQSKGADALGLQAAADQRTADTIAAAVEAAVAKAMATSAAAMQAAADKAQQPIVVESHVTVTAPEGSEVSVA